jgi:hypothetical protein
MQRQVSCSVRRDVVVAVALAWIGAANDSPAGRDWAPPSPQAMSKGAPSSREVFEERRRRYIEANPDSQVAREAAPQKPADANSDGGYFAYYGY